MAQKMGLFCQNGSSRYLLVQKNSSTLWKFKGSKAVMNFATAQSPPLIQLLSVIEVGFGHSPQDAWVFPLPQVTKIQKRVLCIKVCIFWEGHKILRNLLLLLSTVHTDKSYVEISQNSVAFSELYSHVHNDIEYFVFST